VSETTVAEAASAGLERTRTIRLQIPARAEYIALARLALSGLADVVGLSEELLADLKLALTEAVSNSVRHAYAGGGGVVSIAYHLRGPELAIEVVDDGAGFDPDREPLEGELTEGGLGIAIIRAIADHLEIRSRPGVRGSRLRFVKSLHRPHA